MAKMFGGQIIIKIWSKKQFSYDFIYRSLFLNRNKYSNLPETLHNLRVRLPAWGLLPTIRTPSSGLWPRPQPQPSIALPTVTLSTWLIRFKYHQNQPYLFNCQFIVCKTVIKFVCVISKTWHDKIKIFQQVYETCSKQLFADTCLKSLLNWAKSICKMEIKCNCFMVQSNLHWLNPIKEKIEVV